MLGQKALNELEGSCRQYGVSCQAPLTLLQAHEDSEKLREIVLPMEQEIEELKAKLLRAEELIQEIQVRGRPGGAEGRRGAAGPLAPQPLLSPFPRDVPSIPLPCTILWSCCPCPGTRLPRWNPWRS